MPLHALSKSVQEGFGTVRPITTRARNVLERYGFKPSDKYNLLDAGRYYYMPMADMVKHSYYRDLSAKLVEDELKHPTMMTFAPTKRTPANFICARSPARIEGLELLIPARVYRSLNIQDGEDVMAIVD